MRREDRPQDSDLEDSPGAKDSVTVGGRHYTWTEFLLLYKEVLQKVRGLDEKQRVCFLLHYVEGDSYEQISRRTGYTLDQVRSYIQNAKRNLRKKDGGI